MNDPASNAEQLEASRLRQLRARIEGLLREFDTCAHVTIAGREGRFETFTHVEASWSNLRWEPVDVRGGLLLRLRSSAADYGGDTARQKRDLEDSVGVVSGLGEMLGRTALSLIEVARGFDAATGATHTDWRRDDPRDEPGLP